MKMFMLIAVLLFAFGLCIYVVETWTNRLYKPNVRGGRGKGMRGILRRIKTSFCNHDFEVEEITTTITKINKDTEDRLSVYMRCKKCLYHETHWKIPVGWNPYD